jgi:hypothetical protein
MSLRLDLLRENLGYLPSETTIAKKQEIHASPSVQDWDWNKLTITTMSCVPRLSAAMRAAYYIYDSIEERKQ